MKLFFEWISLVLSALGIIYSIYLLYLEILKKREKNKNRFFLLLFVILALLGILESKIDFLFNTTLSALFQQ